MPSSCIIIPVGTFYAMEREQFAAMKRVHELGVQLAQEHPELADMYRDVAKPFVARELGKNLLPTAFEISEDVATTAVTHAVGLLMPREERDAITQIRRSGIMQKKWDFNSPEWREHCRRASVARHSQGIGVNVAAMLKGRNQVAWSADEKALLLKLSTDFSFRNLAGHGGADYAKIAAALNAHFHGGNSVRHKNSCKSMVADHYRKK